MAERNTRQCKPNAEAKPLDPEKGNSSSRRHGPMSILRNMDSSAQWRPIAYEANSDPARVDDLIVLGENAVDRGGMDLKQAVGLGRAR
jgi:hypothetical protein